MEYQLLLVPGKLREVYHTHRINLESASSLYLTSLLAYCFSESNPQKDSVYQPVHFSSVPVSTHLPIITRPQPTFIPPPLSCPSQTSYHLARTHQSSLLQKLPSPPPPPIFSHLGQPSHPRVREGQALGTLTIKYLSSGQPNVLRVRESQNLGRLTITYLSSGDPIIFIDFYIVEETSLKCLKIICHLASQALSLGSLPLC